MQRSKTNGKGAVFQPADAPLPSEKPWTPPGPQEMSFPEPDEVLHLVQGAAQDLHGGLIRRSPAALGAMMGRSSSVPVRYCPGLEVVQHVGEEAIAPMISRGFEMWVGQHESSSSQPELENGGMAQQPPGLEVDSVDSFPFLPANVQVGQVREGEVRHSEIPASGPVGGQAEGSRERVAPELGRPPARTRAKGLGGLSMPDAGERLRSRLPTGAGQAVFERHSLEGNQG